MSTGKVGSKTVSPDVVRRMIRENHERVHSLNAAGTISVETPEIAQSGSFELMLRKPDSVLVKVEGPFGIDVGSALITKDSFLFYNSLRNQLVAGPVNTANLRRIFKVDLTFEELIALFAGGDFLPGDEGDPESIVSEENQIVLTYGSDIGTRRYFIDPALQLITRIQHLDSSGKLFLEARFERIRQAGGAALPRYIRITQHYRRQVVSVAFSSLEVNGDRPPLTLDIPQNAERVKWK